MTSAFPCCCNLTFVVNQQLVVQVFLTPEYLAIAMEYAAGGDMFQLVVRQRGLPETDARWYFQQLIIAIDYCHRMVRQYGTGRQHLLLIVRTGLHVTLRILTQCIASRFQCKLT